MVDVTDQTDVDFGLSGKLSCHASPSLCSAIALSGSLRCFLALGAEDGGEWFLSRFNHSEVDLTVSWVTVFPRKFRRFRRPSGLYRNRFLSPPFFL